MPDTYYIPIAGDEAVDEGEHLELGQLVPGARVHAAPERQEHVGPVRNLHTLIDQSQTTCPRYTCTCRILWIRK